jgi:hypothetical protein
MLGDTAKVDHGRANHVDLGRVSEKGAILAPANVWSSKARVRQRNDGARRGVSAVKSHLTHDRRCRINGEQ